MSEAPRRLPGLVAGAGVGPGGTVLDIGCGWGELSLRVAEAAPSCDAIGVDLGEEALAEATRRASSRGLGLTCLLPRRTRRAHRPRSRRRPRRRRGNPGLGAAGRGEPTPRLRLRLRRHPRPGARRRPGRVRRRHLVRATDTRGHGTPVGARRRVRHPRPAVLTRHRGGVRRHRCGPGVCWRSGTSSRPASSPATRPGSPPTHPTTRKRHRSATAWPPSARGTPTGTAVVLGMGYLQLVAD